MKKRRATRLVGTDDDIESREERDIIYLMPARIAGLALLS